MKNTKNMKNTKSKVKQIKIGKQSGATHYFGCKDYTRNFRPQEVKMKRKSSMCCLSI